MANRDRKALQMRNEEIQRASRPGYRGQKPDLRQIATTVTAVKDMRTSHHQHRHHA